MAHFQLSALQHITLVYSTLLYFTLAHSTLLYITLAYSTLLYITTLHRHAVHSRSRNLEIAVLRLAVVAHDFVKPYKTNDF